MSRPVFDINGYPLNGEFFTREEAEAAIHSYELEDYQAEQEAREQDEERDERMDRGDWEFHRDYDQ